jgi:methylglutaconyl-CoA hydratase
MVENMKNGYVESRLHQGIRAIEFFHPQSNSLPITMLNELTDTIQRAGNDPDTRLVILQSISDKVFCAGASFDELAAVRDAAEGKIFFSGFARVINAMRRCPKFIIARVQGKCVGGGVGLVAAADYAIATELAEVRLSELAVGIGPFVVGPVVERKIGSSAFTQLAIDASMWRNAQWAGRKGLFAEVHATTHGMDDSIAKLADSLLHASPLAMAEMKKTFWRGTENWDELLLERAGISGELITTEHARQAIAQFKKKK